MVWRRSIRVPCLLGSRRRLRRCGQCAAACSSQLPMRRRVGVVEGFERVVGAIHQATGQSVRHADGVVGFRELRDVDRAGPRGPRQSSAVECRAVCAGHSRRRRRGSPQAGLQVGWIQPKHGVGEHGIEHDVETRKILGSVYERQASHPVQVTRATGARAGPVPRRDCLGRWRTPSRRPTAASRPARPRRRPGRRRAVGAGTVTVGSPAVAGPSFGQREPAKREQRRDRRERGEHHRGVLLQHRSAGEF